MAPEASVAEPTREPARPAAPDLSDKQNGQAPPASPLAQSLTRVVGNPTPAKGAEDMGLLEKLHWVESLINSPLLDTLVSVIENPAIAIDAVKDTLGAHLAATPDKIRDQLVAAGVGEGSAHFDEIWAQIKLRLGYMWEHWWDIVKDVLWEIFVPGVTFYRHVPKIFAEMKETWKSAHLGNYGDSIDHLIDLAREVTAILNTLVAQTSIVGFVVGSVLGTPVVGEAALVAIGSVAVASDLVLQAAAIGKGFYDLNQPGLSAERVTELCGRIADAGVSAGITVALMLLGAGATMAARKLVGTFPKLVPTVKAAVEDARVKVGLGPKKPEVAFPQDYANLARKVGQPPPAATEFPERARLTPEQQEVFDQWVQARRADKTKPSAQVEQEIQRSLANKNPAEVMRTIKSGQRLVNERQKGMGDMARIRAYGDPLNPTMAHGPEQVPGHDVWLSWDKKKPNLADEIEPAQRFSDLTGERVHLYGGDAYPGIDGTVGEPPRALQIKRVPQNAHQATTIAEQVESARAGAAGAEYSRIEVLIDAEGMTIEQAKAEFAKTPGRSIARRVMHPETTRIHILCTDGIYEPPVQVGISQGVRHVDVQHGRDDKPAR